MEHFLTKRFEELLHDLMESVRELKDDVAEMVDNHDLGFSEDPLIEYLPSTLEQHLLLCLHALTEIEQEIPHAKDFKVRMEDVPKVAKALGRSFTREEWDTFVFDLDKEGFEIVKK